ncbi:MAG: hypothetical protein ACPG5B_11310 [Chitinophagales bacterium]
MKKLFLAGLFFLMSQYIFAQQDKYVYEINLQEVENDEVKIKLNVPKLKKNKATFVMPSVIPGSYSRKDYGRFVQKIKAYDKNGKALKLKQKKNNLFIIKKAKRLATLEYNIADTWDHDDGNNWVFEPGGSNIEKATNFSINNHAFFGYFENYKNMPFELHFQKPTNMYGATSLERKKSDSKSDVFAAANYVQLVDAPIMYCEPDTMSFPINNMDVEVSVYSPNDIVTAEQIVGYLQPLGRALGKFFGTLPVDKYHFLMYFADPTQSQAPQDKTGYGALEHSYSSFYYLPEMNYEPLIKGMIQDVCSHEFLHILTPLNIHSEEIEDFNFIEPEMSQHLWMYEGITEYFAMLIQVQDNIIDEKEFVNKIKTKIRTAGEFVPLSFTKMSKEVIKDKYQAHYLDVYQKGALIGLGLDLKLIELSKGTRNLKTLMMELAKKYGPNRPFKDDELIDEIVAMTYPEIRTFFDKYVIGPDRLPYNELFKIVGWEFVKNGEQKVFSFGSFGLGFNPETTEIFFVDVEENTLGLQEKDILVSIEGEKITAENASTLLADYLFGKKDDYPINMLVKRGDKEVKLAGAAQKTTRKVTNAIEPMQNASKEQLEYLEILLTGKLK